MSSIDLWKFLAGLGLFLYGVSLMELVTKRIGGRSFKLFLRNHTRSLPKAIMGGTVITGLIQSSSVVIMMLMSFAGAGIISSRNALGVLIGSNLGTTVDSWFYATIGFKFNIQSYALPIIALTAMVMFFTARRKQLYDSLNFIFSIGMLMLGFGFMKEGAGNLVLKFNLAAYADYNLFVILLAGFVITVLVQSSAATVAIALTALHAHALSFPAAACIIIGSETGTTIKFLFSSLQGSSEKRILAWGDFLFNLFTTIISFSFLSWIIYFITELIGIKDPLTGLVFFQSFINLISILIFIPFISLFSNWLEKIFGKKGDARESILSKELPAIAELAPALMQKSAADILQRVIHFHRKIFNIAEEKSSNGFLPQVRSFTRVHGTTIKEYAGIKETEGDILKYYIGLQKEDLVKADYEMVNHSLTAIRESIHAAKSVHDIRHDLDAFNSSANDFLFRQYHSLQQDWNSFDSNYNLLLNEEDASAIRPALERLKDLAFSQFRLQANLIEKPLANRELNELEASTLLNVYQEILSCKKALLKALALLKLPFTEPGGAAEFTV